MKRTESRTRGAAKGQPLDHDGRGRRFVALWRGINVGKAKRIRMAELRALLADLGYESPRTLLNSGNAVFDVAEAEGVPGSAPERLRSVLEASVADALGVDSRVTVLSADRFRKVVAAQPFAGELAEAIDESPAFLVVNFYAAEAVASELGEVASGDWGDEQIVLGRHAAYCWLPRGQANSDLAKAVARAGGEGLTARNWKTVVRIASLLE